MTEIPIIQKLRSFRLIHQGAPKPLMDEAAAIIMEMVEALERFKRIALRKDMSAAAKVACIESIAHTTLAKVRSK